MGNSFFANRLLSLLLGAAVLSAGALGCSRMQHAQTSAQQESGWITLFNGQKNQLQNWTMVGPGGFTLQENGSLLSEGGMGLFYYRERTFRDYVLELDWKAESDSTNSGIFLRFPEQPTEPAAAAESGYELQIFNPGAPLHQTGSIQDNSAPFKLAAKPAGQWNTYRIRVTGQRYQVWLNGEKVNDFMGNRGREGYIGIQNFGPDSQIAYRNIRVKQLSEEEVDTPETLADLFASDDASADPIRVLMLTSTYGFRHESAIETAKPLMEELETTTEFEFDITEDVNELNRNTLQNYDLIFFNNTTGNLPVTEEQKQAILDFLRDGNGFVGTHAAADTWYNWAPYREMLGGGLFQSHPWTQSVGIKIEDTDNPAVNHFGEDFHIRDEIYVLDANPRWNSHVLASLDMQSVGVEQGPASSDRNDYPIAWIRNYNGGRVFYTKLGHFADVWRTPMFLEHLLQGMRMAAGRIEADFSGHREKETVADDVWPDDIAVDERGDVWIAELQGKVHRYDAQTGETRQIGQVNTTDPTKIEHGLYGIEIDPNFYDGEPYIYLFYAEPETFINTLYRYEYRDGEIDMSTEQVLLRVPTEPNCCHQAGDLEWGPDGTLYVSTGDTGMSETRPSWELTDEEIQAFVDRYDLKDYHWSRLVDSERSAQNLQDLRGKILRINKDGTIPQDNPFYGQAGVRWEIYAYGYRNPYRFKVDQETGDLYAGVVGPDESVTYDEYNLSAEGGENFGWPRTLGRLFFNEWTANMIPNFVPPLWEYTYETGGRSATVGPIYRSDAEYAFPSAFQDKVFIFDWARRWIKWVDVKETTFTNDVEADMKKDTYAIELPAQRFVDIKNFDVLDETTPISMELAPDGSIYLAEFDGFWNAGPNAKVTRYRWISGNQAPIAELSVDRHAGQAPLTVQFDGSRSYDPNADDVSYQWTFGDGSTGSSASPSHTYESEGTYTAELIVTDSEGLTSRAATAPITVGNTAPTAEITSPAAGTLLNPTGSPVVLRGQASDPENGMLSGQHLQWTVTAEYMKDGSLQRTEVASFKGTSGKLDLAETNKWGDRARYHVSLTATDTDGLRTEAEQTLRNSRLQAEIADESAGFVVEDDTVQVANRSGDYLVWRNVSFDQYNRALLQLSPGTAGGTVDLRLGSVQGKRIGTVDLEGEMHDERTWKTEEFALTDANSSHDVYVVVRDHGRGDVPIAVDWLKFVSR